jgi:hypothetical protein
MAQHTSPCGNCLFRRESPSGAVDIEVMGGSQPEVYLGQTQGPFWIPCHTFYENVLDARWKLSTNQCAGAAIFSANCGRKLGPELEGQLLTLPPDTEKVFGTPAEFIAHHRGCTLEQAEEFLKQFPPEFWLKVELKKAEVRFVDPDVLAEVKPSPK